MQTSPVYSISLGQHFKVLQMQPLAIAEPRHDNATFCQMMIESCLKAGYSKKQIAAEIGVSSRTISLLQQGLIQSPRSQAFSKLLSLYCACCYDKNGYPTN